MSIKYFIISFILIIGLSFFTSSISYAQQEADPPIDTADKQVTPQDDEKETIIKKRITDLKDRLATRVAQLQMINKRAFYGVLNDKTDTKFVLTYKDVEQLVATDTETLFYSQNITGKRTKTDLESLDPGQLVVVFGTLDIDGKTIIAQETVAQVMPTIYFGSVTDVDTNAGTFTVSNDETTIFDYDIGTKCVFYVDEDEIETCGLSKIEEGARVIVRGQPDATDLTSAKAFRILVLPSKVATSSSVKTENTPTEQPTEATP